MKPSPFRHLVCLGPLAVACSSGGGERQPVGSTVAQSLAKVNTAPAVQAARVRNLSTIPNSVCTLAGTGPNEPDAPTFHADDYGQMSVSYLRMQPDGDRLLLDCTAPSGKHDTIDVESAPDGIRHTLSDPLAAGHHLRPALSGDPLGYSPEEIRARGFPPRPDPMTAPGRYANWLKMASRTMEYTPSPPTDREGPAFSRVLNTAHSWSGGEIFPGARPFDEAEGAFNVPTVTPFSGSCGGLCRTGTGAIWVGLDGTPNSLSGDIVQAGVEFDSYLYGSVAFAVYTAWTEYWPAKSIPVPGWTVSADDEFFDLVWVGDASGNINVNGKTAWFEPVDYSTGLFTEIHAPITAGFVGASAEWIIENKGPCFRITDPRRSRDVRGRQRKQRVGLRQCRQLAVHLDDTWQHSIPCLHQSGRFRSRLRMARGSVARRGNPVAHSSAPGPDGYRASSPRCWLADAVVSVHGTDGYRATALWVSGIPPTARGSECGRIGVRYRGVSGIGPVGIGHPSYGAG